jgi:undecaprenol kinase/diacylglycerol kinase (ATP)
MHKRIKSFRYAFEGLGTLLREEPNARIHLVAALVVTFAGIWFRVSSAEWLVLMLTFGMVIALEILNSVVERIADFVSPERHPAIKKIKDLAAAGVLVTAITAVMVGVIIFLPKILAA